MSEHHDSCRCPKCIREAEGLMAYPSPSDLAGAKERIAALELRIGALESQTVDQAMDERRHIPEALKDSKRLDFLGGAPLVYQHRI